MSSIKRWGILLFAFGCVIVAKYIPFAAWVENNRWIAMPMIILGLAMFTIDWKGGEGDG